MQQHTSKPNAATSKPNAAAAKSNPKPPGPSTIGNTPSTANTLRAAESSKAAPNPARKRDRQRPSSAAGGSRHLPPRSEREPDRDGAGRGRRDGFGRRRWERGWRRGAYPSLRGRAPVHAERQRRGAVVAVLRGAGGLLPPRRRRRHRRRAARNGGIGADESAEASRRRFRSFPLVLEGD